MLLKFKKMNNLLKLEELGQLVVSILFFSQMEYAWWVFPACILLPDLSMIGYLFNSKAGAWLYNFFHHKLVALMVSALGFWLGHPLLMLAGLVLFGHAAMDRIFGYGLKFNDHFEHTHLGWIGRKGKAVVEAEENIL